MFFCGKKVCYLSVYEHKEKKKAAGFVKISGEGEWAHINIQIKNAGQKWNGSYRLWLLSDDQKISLGSLNLEKGNGIYEKKFELSANGMKVLAEYFSIESVTGILAEGNEDEEISGRFKESKTEQVKKDEQVTRGEQVERGEQVKNDMLVLKETTEIKTAEKMSGEVQENSEILKEKEERKKWDKQTMQMHSVLQEDFAVDKWEQLLKNFGNVHPFGDERVFISIGPENFVILRENYQKLVNNSFLLHGFYNYRHLILGKEKRIGNSYETCFYLGVPGVYFEREKMVAVMFGFEGFECAGPVEIGKFGYYLRQVEI